MQVERCRAKQAKDGRPCLNPAKVDGLCGFHQPKTPKSVAVDRVLATYRVGSRDWGWVQEATDLLERDGASLADALRKMAATGSGGSLLLGPDDRVWDGHHRIVAAAMLDGLQALIRADNSRTVS